MCLLSMNLFWTLFSRYTCWLVVEWFSRYPHWFALNRCNFLIFHVNQLFTILSNNFSRQHISEWQNQTAITSSWKTPYKSYALQFRRQDLNFFKGILRKNFLLLASAIFLAQALAYSSWLHTNPSPWSEQSIGLNTNVSAIALIFIQTYVTGVDRVMVQT